MVGDLLLICHASTPSVRAAAFPVDEAIDGAGARAARKAARKLADAMPAPERVLCAPSIAARGTAAGLGFADVIEVPELADCDYGRWAGRRVSDVARDEPEAFGEWMTDPTAAPHGGETLTRLIERLDGFLSRCQSMPGVTIAVTHAAVVRAAVVAAVAATPATVWHLDIGPLTQARLRTDGRRWALRHLGALHQGASDG